jgi:plasmid stabilization system protein ParE
MMRVVISARVQGFLRHERSYLQRHSTTAWKKLSDRLRRARKLLAEFPYIGAEKPLPVPGLRRLVMGDYVLDYEIRDGEVHILNMRHGRQNDPDLEGEPDFDYEDAAKS